MVETFNRLRFCLHGIEANRYDPWYLLETRLRIDFLPEELVEDRDRVVTPRARDHYFHREVDGALLFKPKTNDFQLLKCPVNPQQTSFQYIRLMKRSMKLIDLLEKLSDFYISPGNTTRSRLFFESVISVENDRDGVVDRLRKQMESPQGAARICWANFLGWTSRFARMYETVEHGYVTYVIQFDRPDNAPLVDRPEGQ